MSASSPERRRESIPLDEVKITSSLRYVLRSQAMALMEKLDVLPTDLPRKSVLPIKEFCHLKQVPIVQIINLWVQGELDGKICRSVGTGLKAIEIDWTFLSDKTLLVFVGEAIRDALDPRKTFSKPSIA